MRLGIFSTFAEQAALDLARSVLNAIENREIPDTELAFIFSNRGYTENAVTTEILTKQLKPALVRSRSTSEDFDLITFSAARFKPEMRKKAKGLEREGDITLINEWRNEFGEEVLKSLPPTDIDLLLGDWFIWGKSLCEARNGINLHPALPDGPKGEWYNVIWDLIKNRSMETGVMMHKVTEELDRGPAVTYCRFPIVGAHFDHLWRGLPTNPEELNKVIKSGLAKKELATHPLHREIRRHGLAREMVLIVKTAKAFAEGRVAINGESVVDRFGEPLDGGYDLTQEIDEEVKLQLEGQLTARKEVR